MVVRAYTRCLLMVLCSGLTSLPALAQTFHSLGLSSPTAASADGSVVVGRTSAGQVMRWTAAGGVQSLPLNGTPLAISGDGSTIVGRVTGASAFRWTQAAGFQQDIPRLVFAAGNTATAVNYNGTVIAGHTFYANGQILNPYRWQVGSPTAQPLTLGGTSPPNASVSAMSQDGSTIVGIRNPNSGADTGYRWTAATAMDDIGSFNGRSAISAVAVSTDGAFVTGSIAATGAYRWSAGTGIELISTTLIPTGMSGNATTIVGYTTFQGVQSAALWYGGTTYDLRALTVSLGIDLNGWTMTRATGISSDGRTVFGVGSFNGATSHFVLSNIPSPGAASLGGLMALGTTLIRRRRPRR